MENSHVPEYTTEILNLINSGIGLLPIGWTVGQDACVSMIPEKYLSKTPNIFTCFTAKAL